MGSGSAYDVIIIGGGPAGSAAGRTLAGSGVRALIVEKARHPRPKPCGGLLSGHSVDALDAIFGAEVLSRVSLAEVHGCRLFRRDARIGEVTDAPRMVLTRREVLDETLFRAAAAAGCDVREDAEAVSLRPAGGEVVLASGETLRARAILVADGASGSIARRRRPGILRRREVGFGLVAEAPIGLLTDDAPIPRIHFGLFRWGYGWVFPRGDTVNIGVGGRLRRKTDFRGVLRELVAMTCRPGAWEQLRPRGHRLPYGNCASRPGRANVLRIGDAAGLVESLTGEGIAGALDSGRLAADATSSALDDGRPARAGRRYNALAARHILPRLRAARVARYVFFPRPVFPLAMFALSRNADRIRWFLEILAGEISYGEYFRRLCHSI